MIGKTISHYKIIEQLGAGGMGVVYKAEDTKLKRTVALKFLPQELTRDPEAKERFIREAQTASALEHNNICNIHEIDETEGGQLFIAMACYEGESLKEKIESGPLKIETAIDITIQIARGLEKAHERGIIHRDIKPGNIFITAEGNAKILDFGLAKLVGQAQLTKDSSTLGTVAYMSPEQLSGEVVDQRTDIWSLGVVLYEMLSGQSPFKGDYEQAIIYSILNEEPQLSIASEKLFSAEIEKIISRALMKNPQERYSSAAELLQDLSSIYENFGINKSTPKSIKPKSTKTRTVIISSVVIFILLAAIAGILFYPTSEPEVPIKSLAVLPFTNIGNDAATDYLGFSLANQIIGDLTYLKNITVRPSTSIEKYKDQSVDPIEAASELQVEFLVTGRYLKEANKIRSDIELINVRTNKLIWREPIEVNFENAFQLQDIISEKVIDGLRIQFSQDERERMQRDIPKNPIAYEYYLRSLSYPLTQDGHSLALNMLKESIKLDSTYAPAFVEMGFRTIRLAQNIFGGRIQLKMAEKYFLKAKAINPDLFDGLAELATVYIETGRIDDAMSNLQNVLQINPNNANARFNLSYLYRYAGLLKESEYEAEKALQIDPTNKRYRSIGHTYLYIGKYEKAIEGYNLDSSSAWAHANKGAIYLRDNKDELALKSFNRAIELEQSTFPRFLASGLKAYIEGKQDSGLRITAEWERKDLWDAEMIYRIACNYSLFGDAKSSARALKRSIDAGFFNYPFLISDPFLDPVRDDPEFQKVLALAKAKHEAFKQKYFAKEL